MAMIRRELDPTATKEHAPTRPAGDVSRHVTSPQEPMSSAAVTPPLGRGTIKRYIAREAYPVFRDSIT